MIEIRKKLKLASAAKAAYGVKVQGRLMLPFGVRQKTRVRIVPPSGEEVTLMLPPGEVLHDGDLVVASDGSIIEILASPEQVLQVTCEKTEDLTRAAYLLGSRHVALEVGKGYLRLLDDPAHKQMLEGLGARVEAMQAPFEPDAGLSVDGAHTHEQGHVHGADCGHDHHGHGHNHDQHGHGHVHGPDCGHDHARGRIYDVDEGHAGAHEAHGHGSGQGHDHQHDEHCGHDHSQPRGHDHEHHSHHHGHDHKGQGHK